MFCLHELICCKLIVKSLENYKASFAVGIVSEVKTGNIFTMPGLPIKPAAEGIDIDEEGNIIGIF